MAKVLGGALLTPLLLTTVVPAVPAQEETPKPPLEEGFGEELVITEVLLDVLVTDKNDRVILGLGADDFVVSENGDAVQITSVTFYSSRRLMEKTARMASRGGQVDMVPRDRYFIVFVQEQRPGTGIAGRSPFVRQMEAGRDLERWLMEEAPAVDRVAVVSYGRALRIHQDFTTDREALTQAIDGAVRGRDPEKIPPSRRPDVESDPAAFSVLPTGKELRKASRDIYRALGLVADAVASVPGRKNLIFLGRGFGDISSFGGYRPEPHKLNPALNALNNANVAVYTLDISTPGTRDNLQVSLRDLAVDTGGRFFWELKQFTTPLEKISDLTSGYYLLSYESRRPADVSGYQRVRVATRNPEFRIQARDGYLYGSKPKP